MSATLTATEVLAMQRGAQIRTSRCETIQRYLEWHGFHAAEISGPFVTYRRDNLSGLFIAPEPATPTLISVY